MYRLTNQLANPNLVLVRKQIGDGSCAALVVMRAPQRRYASDQSNKSRPPPKSRKLLWTTIGASMLTGAAVVYAKGNPDARNWLEANAPWASDFVALVYQENTSYWKFSANQFNKATTILGNFLFGKEGITPEAPPLGLEEAAKDVAKPNYKSSKSGEKGLDKVPPTKFEPFYVEEKKIETPEIKAEATLVQTEKCDPVTPEPITISKDMVELEHDMHENTKRAIDNYKKATKLCEEYNKALIKIVEYSHDDLSKKDYKELQAAQTARTTTVKTAKEASRKAKCAIDTLDRMIKAGVRAPPESIAGTKRYINQFRADLHEVEVAYNEAAEKAVLSDKYWDKVVTARSAYRQELAMLFPSMDVSARKLDAGTDTDLLLLYTLKQVQMLQNEIAELQTVRELKMRKAIECLDEKALIEAKVEDVVKRDKIEREREYQKKSFQFQAEANRNLREQLKQQFEIQQEVMHDKLSRKEKEVLDKCVRLVSEQVEYERCEFKKELAAVAGKLQAIEQTVKQRAKAETEARKSQSLWSAAEALHAATRRTTPEADIDKEIKALEKVGKDDKLVQTVLKCIPQEVRENGIVTEKALKDRFTVLEKSAAKVALVGKEGASLPVYFLSWLQSKILFQKFAEIPKTELDNLPTDFTKLDTFDIIQRARYYLDRGDIAATLKYLNLLQGAPRALAAKWADAARRHLEIRQAAEAVMAHAVACAQLANM